MVPVFSIVIVILVFFSGCAQSPSATGQADMNAAKYLCAANSNSRVYSCGNSTYLVEPLAADLGTRYVDANGTVLARCNGFINLPQPQECLQYRQLECNVSVNLCEKPQ